MIKQVLPYSENRADILRGVRIISDPIRQTISPKGKNVVFENDIGNVYSTNDGATLARMTSVKDPVQNAIIEIIKQASLKTNGEAGDGTSTTVLLSDILINEGFKLIDNGVNQMDLKREFEKFGASIITNLKKKAIQIKTDKDLENIANISANNDRVIARDVAKVIKTAGLDGMVFIEPNNKAETEIIEDSGFHVDAGMLSPELRNDRSRFSASYINVPVLVTDKRIYYQEEAETILKVALMAGYKEIVIVAKDFIGQSVNYFLANHNQQVISVLLVKDPRAADKNTESLEDLAIYLGGKVVSEKNGSLVNKLKITDFCWAEKVFADQVKTLITTNKKNSLELKKRIEAVRGELKKDKDDKNVQKRLAALTNGMVTIRVGGNTQIEINEKIYRFEDAVNATRAAKRDGYLVGGGISLKNAFQAKKYPEEYRTAFRKFCEGNIRQIAENCDRYPDTVLETIEGMSEIMDDSNIGYNAMTDKYENLLLAGVIDPYKVTEMAVLNSISVATQILSANYLILNDVENIKDKTDAKS